MVSLVSFSDQFGFFDFLRKKLYGFLAKNPSQIKLPDFKSPSGDSLSKSANFELSK